MIEAWLFLFWTMSSSGWENGQQLATYPTRVVCDSARFEGQRWVDWDEYGAPSRTFFGGCQPRDGADWSKPHSPAGPGWRGDH